MAPNITNRPPTARSDPPWGCCGDPAAPEFGAVFARAGARNAAVLSYDRGGQLHAATLFDRRALGPEIVLQGRRFRVERLDSGARGA